MARAFTLDFLRTETAAGAALVLAALAALIAANSPWSEPYFAFLGQPVTLQAGAWIETRSLYEWVKEGLMAVFFFIVGMEIKHEVLRGELSNPRKLALPVLAAVGGMAGPALVYLLVNQGGGRPEGWPIPAATDIAFALAALAVFGRGLPGSLRVFLLTLAIVDDLGAVALIAVLYTSDLDLGALAGAVIALGFMMLVSRYRKASTLLYAVGFIVVWAFTLESGISTSLAGIAAALTIPIAPPRPGEDGVLEDYMESLHPYVAFGVLPLFAFASAGVPLSALSPGVLLQPAPLGVMLGLFVGKQIGVFGLAWLAVRLGWARPPSGATWLEVYGVSLLCGVGFTMSLFIGALAFPDDAGLQTAIRAGVLGGSVLSLIGAAIVLQIASAARARRGVAAAPA